MLKKFLWLSFTFLLTFTVSAQHEDKVLMKIDQTQALKVKVEQSQLSTDKKMWAVEALNENLVVLEANQSEPNIEKLKQAEVEINKINQLVVQALIEAQRQKLITKIKAIDGLIIKYVNEGQNVEQLQALQMTMMERLALYD